MLVVIPRKAYYVSRDAERALHAIVFGGRSDESVATAITNRPYDRLNDWVVVRDQLCSSLCSLQAKLESGVSVGMRSLSESFHFAEEAARDNVIDLLHAYAILSGQIGVRPVARSMPESISNKMSLGYPWARLCGDEATVAFSLRPRSSWTRWTKAPFDSTTPIYKDAVLSCRGTLRDWTLELIGVRLSLGAEVRFTLLPARPRTML